jgi:hypothetical protein
LTIVCLLVIFGMAMPFVQQASANPNLPADLSYSTETTWILPSLPHLSAAAGYIPHNLSHGQALFDLGDEVIHGFRPGKDYLEMYVRDIAWGMETVQYYYPDQYLREPIEAYLRRQYTADTRSLDGDFDVLAGEGAIGGIITPEGQSDKETITSDEETSLIHAAYLYYTTAYNADWLQSSINGLSIIERLNRAADWLYSHRLDPELQLIWRGHTTDWGDVKFEKSSNYTDYDPEQDHLTASIYDQAMAYMAWIELAEMNAAVGDTARATEWQARADALKEQTNARLWQADKGFYLTHVHITPLEHDFDESAMVSISNALAIYAGLADFEQSQAILHNLERVRLEAGADKPGLSLYPYYPNQWPNLFFDYLGMGYGNYQNGGVWDWWGGVQIKTEFLNGFAEDATTHLLQVASDWARHPGNIIEWQSTTAPERHEGSHYYSAAAGTMGSAIIEGFFGVELSGNELTLQPRLGLNDGFIRVYQPLTDRYAAYRYDWDQDVIKVDYGTNAEGSVAIEILKSWTQHVLTVTVDSQPVEFDTDTMGNDTYIVLTAPTGQHSLEIVLGSPPTPPAATEAASAVADTIVNSPPTTASVAPSPTTALEAVTPTQQAVVEPPETSPSENDAIAQEVAGSGTSEPSHSSAATPTTTGVNNWEAWLRLIQSISTALVVFSGLGLIVLIVLRSRGGS